ncbi:MAG TPA: cysteine--tRNA ligase, partial [Gammaproteobacteria bacterium]|nr:cysteine--tRNA ligase [Gammaproteobacteria bacterium]
PDKEPRATENIQIILDLINKLIEGGYAYHEGRDVYFSVESFPNYGKLSNQKMDEILSGARVEIDKEKKNPADFVLWKRSDKGLAWDSPWGRGRPGWHIECSAMSMDALGESFDIHAGGSDLKFPHHENEIAQSESATGNKFAKYWMHTGPLRIDKKKMSKSLDNFLTIRDALKNYPYEIIRYFLLSSHYRSPVNYSETALDDAKAALGRLYTSIHDVDISDEGIAAKGLHTEQFQQAMDDDFNVPEALAVLFDLAKTVNKAKENGDLERTKLLVNELIHLSKPLGLLQQDPEIFLKSGVNVNESEIEAFIDKREKARDSGDYSAADEIRDQLFEQNIILEDSKEGTFWRRR